MLISKGQLGLETKIKDSQKSLLDTFGNVTQKQEDYYKEFENLKNQGMLNFPYRESELSQIVKKNMTHLKKGYEMYSWEIFQSLKVSYICMNYKQKFFLQDISRNQRTL